MWVSEYRHFWGKISPLLKQNIAVYEANIEYRIFKSPISRIAVKVFQGPIYMTFECFYIMFKDKIYLNLNQLIGRRKEMSENEIHSIV